MKSAWPYRWPDLPWLGGIAAVYAFLTKLSLDFFAAFGLVATFWPAAGFALAALLLGGRKLWVGIYVGALAGHLWAGLRPGEAALISVGNALEPLLGAWLLSRTGDFNPSLRSFRDYFRLCSLAAVISPSVCALYGVGTLALFGLIDGEQFWRQATYWWMGDTLGIVVVAPLIMVWRKRPEQPWNMAEAAAIFGLSFLAGQVIFINWWPALFGSINRGYWMYPLISWAAVRLGLHGVLVVLSMTTLQGLAGAALKLGYFGSDLAMANLTNFWAFTMILVTVGIALAILFAERRLAGEELGKLSLAVTQSPVSIVITDLESRIEYVNPAFTQVSGYSAEEVLGQNPRLLNSGHTPRATYQELWAMLHAGKAWHGEFINRRKDGSDYLETATISPLRQADGRVTHYVAVKADITELKRALTELRASEGRLQLAKAAAGLGVYDHDIANGKLEWDGRTRALWGVGPEEPVSYATFIEGLHPGDRAATLAAIDRALDPGGNGIYQAEYRVVSGADGGVRHIAANGQVFFEQGRAVRIVGTVKDVSKQKRLEKELQERRSEMELLIKQQVAAQTAAAIAHELNQPLVSISAYSDAALRMLRSGSKQPEKLAHALEGAAEQAQRAGRTLHELLNFLHKGEAAAEAVDLNEVLCEALVIAAEGGYSGFQPIVELEPGLAPVLANRLQLQKVMVNLVHNGVEAMRDAGVPAAAITIRVRTKAECNMALVTMQDNGPGLNAETIHRIFDPFFTTKPNGIGLGLAISRALIEAYGGQLWADPEAGPGATFHMTLPFAP